MPIILILAFLAAPAMAADNPTHFEFSGTVERGQNYTHELPRGLYLHLVRNKGRADDDKDNPDGWDVVIDDKKDDSGESFLNLTSAPNGPAPTEIEAWHFRNDANSGPRDENDIPFDKLHRDYQFLLSEKETKAAITQMQCERDADQTCAKIKDDAGNEACHEKQGTICEAIFTPREVAVISLEITHYDLDNLMSNQKPYIKNLSFTVSGDYEAPPQEE